MERNISRNLSSSLTTPLILIIFISFSCLYQAIAIGIGIESRQALEIGIGIGGGTSPPAYPPPDNGDCPDCTQPPQLPPCPPPPPPPPTPCPLPPKKPKPSPPPPPPPEYPPPKTPFPPPPPPPSPRPRPGPPHNNIPFGLTVELSQNIKDIMRFKTTITNDPFNITKTWVGQKLCIDKNKYKGFVCDTTRGTNVPRVAGVKFNGYSFGGGDNYTLAGIMGKLKGLIFFHANSNRFKDGVTNDFNKLRTLYEFDLSNNNLTGGFPKPILAGNLTFLDLRFNHFTGSVPSQAFNLDLDALFLNNNMFSGEIPINLGSTPAVYLTLANNMFRGPIPKSIGHAGNTLIEVLLLNNTLSGCLPYEIGLLKKAEVFDASLNQLMGPIPLSFGCLQRMQELNLANNHLYGAVPEELCSVKSLQKLTLRYNYFTQVGPKCRDLIDRRILDLSMNCIIDLKSRREPKACKDFFLKHPHDNCPLQHHIPCKIDLSATQLTDESAEKKPSKTHRAYAALHRHHHH